MKIDLNNKRIVISRTDSIGDVLLTLPICTWIKKHYPESCILFLGREYTRAVVDSYMHVDEFIDRDKLFNNPPGAVVQHLRELNADVFIHVFPDKELAAAVKKAGIPVRVGTAHRTFHLLTCTHRINFTRKRSPLHEAQLNHFLLKPFGLQEVPELTELHSHTKYFKVPTMELPALVSTKKNYVVLHPGSKGSAVDWPIDHYVALAALLNESGLPVVLTGNMTEGAQFGKQFEQLPDITNTCGKLTLNELICVIAGAKAFVACSTGPLHIAGFVGIQTIGLFSPRRPIHPGRWQPLGEKVKICVYDPECGPCKKGKLCTCIRGISPETVLHAIID